MANIQNEIESINDYVMAKLVGVKCLNYLPESYTPGDMLIRMQTSGSEQETRLHYRLDRTFQLVYFADSEIACLTKMNELETQFNNDQVIPLNGTAGEARYLRIGSFSLSQPFESDGGTSAIIGVLTANLREASSLEQHEKIQVVNATIKE